MVYRIHSDMLSQRSITGFVVLCHVIASVSILW